MSGAYRDYFDKLSEFLAQAGKVSGLTGYATIIESGAATREILTQFERGAYHGSMDALERSIRYHRRQAEEAWRLLERAAIAIGHPIGETARRGFMKYGFMSVSDAPKNPKGKGNLDFRKTIRSFIKSDEKKLESGKIEKPRFVDELWTDFAAKIH